MLDNHGNAVKAKKVKMSKSFIEHFDNWYAKYTKEEDISKRTGRLDINNTHAIIYSEWSIEDRTEFICDIFETFYKHKATKIYRGELEENDIDSIIGECAFEVAKLDPLETFPNINHYIYNKVRKECSDEVKRRKAIKRGGEASYVYLDDENTFLEIPYKEDNTKIELKILLEQIKASLTKNEHDYVSLVINIPYIPTNREVARLLQMTPDGVRYIKNSLKNKLAFLVEK